MIRHGIPAQYYDKCSRSKETKHLFHMTKTKLRRKGLFESIFPCWSSESSEEEDEGEDEDDDKFADLDFDREEIQKYRENENFFD